MIHLPSYDVPRAELLQISFQGNQCLKNMFANFIQAI